MSIQKLQNAIIDGKPLDRELDLDSLLPNPITEDSYATVLYAADNGIIDPLVLLQTAIRLTIEQGYNYFQIIGLALRVIISKGLSPNIYITVAGSDDVVAVVHILYYVWLITPKSTGDMFLSFEGLTTYELTKELEEVQNRMLNIMALLAAGGANPDEQVINADIYLQRLREISDNPSGVSQARALVDVGVPRSVGRAILDQGTQTLDETADIRLVEELGIVAVERMRLYYRRRQNLADLYDANIGEFEGPNRLVTNIIELLDDPGSTVVYETGQYPLKYDAQGRLFAEYDGDGNLVVEPEDESLNSMKVRSCANLHANKCIKKFIDAELLTFSEAEKAMFETLDAYNIVGFTMFLDAGLQPKYNHVDRVISRSVEKLNDNLPFSSALMNNALVRMVERGMGIDDEQLRRIYDVSASTHSKIKALQRIPHWKRTCKVPYGIYIRQDLRDLARELNLPPDIDKRTLCAELIAIDQASEDSLEKIALELSKRRLKAETTSIGDVVRTAAEKRTPMVAAERIAEPRVIDPLETQEPLESGSTTTDTRSLSPRYVAGQLSPRMVRSSASFVAPSVATPPSVTNGCICINAERLARPETDYADLDLVMVPEGVDTYCFETADYQTLLEKEVNPITGLPLTQKTLKEIQSKLDTIRTTNVPLESKGIMSALKQVKAKVKGDEYENWIKRRRNLFYELSEFYGIDRRNFTILPEDGGLDNETMQDLARALLFDDNVDFDLTSREGSTRSLSSTIMELVDETAYLPMGERDIRVNEIFEDLGALITNPNLFVPQE